MKSIDEIDRFDLKDHLLKNWMTHDALWFFQVLQKCGIEAANEMNKASIKALAAFETQRARRLLAVEEERITSIVQLKAFFEGTFRLSTGGFMGFTYDWPEENVLQWDFKDGACFAYKGMQRLGVADRYDCGVIYRILMWIEQMGIRYEVSPKIEGCLQHTTGKCTGRVRLFFD